MANNNNYYGGLGDQAGILNIGDLVEILMPGLGFTASTARNSTQPNRSTTPTQSTRATRVVQKISLDIVNTSEYVYVYAELPGVDKNALDIDFYNNKLTILAEKNRPYNEPDMGEISYGRIERTITLPICVTSKDAVRVSSKDGILTIKIDKLIEEKNKFSIRVSDDNDSSCEEKI